MILGSVKVDKELLLHVTFENQFISIMKYGFEPSMFYIIL